MNALLASTACGCARPLPLRQRPFSGFSSPLPSLHGLRSDPPSAAGVCRMKKDTHPEYHEEAKVYCNGEEVMVTSGTQPKYTVDVWSGNHPFFKGASSAMVLDEGRVNRFKRRYAGLEQMSDMTTMKAGDGQEVDLAAFKKSQQKTKGKGKGKK